MITVGIIFPSSKEARSEPLFRLIPNLKNPYGTISGTDYAVYNGSNSNAPDNEGLTFFYIGNWGTDCVIRIQSYWMNKNNNNYDHLNECLR